MPNAKIYIDPLGQTVPAAYVKPYDKKRDRIANRIELMWRNERARLAKLKLATIALIEELQAEAAKTAAAPNLGGEQGNVQFRNFDGLTTIRLDNAKRTEFDERLQIAQRLIMDAVAELASGVTDHDLVEMVTRAFAPGKSGNLDMSRIRDLRNYNVKHAKWKKAIEIINECERTIGHKQYVRVEVRADRDAKPEAIKLDIASL